MAKKKGTAAPSGLKISRSGNKFTVSWKRGAKYTSQAVSYRTGTGSWKALSGISATQTSKSVTIDISKTFPSVGFAVKGKKKSWSGWTYATFNIAKPSNPKVSCTLNSEFKSTFNWEIPNVDSASKAVYYRYEWQTVLIKDCNTSDGSKVSWAGAYVNRGTATSGSWAKEETGWSEPGYSYTRWFRVRAVGPAGPTIWVYTHHTYARSEKTANVTATFTENEGAGFTVSVNWTTQSSFAKPVDKTTVQYLIDEPASSVRQVGDTMVTTLTCPSSGSWSSINALGSLGGDRGLAFVVGQDLQPNQVIFVRVNTLHDADSSTVDGDPIMVTGARLILADPSDIHISDIDTTTRRVTVNAKNNSNISASFLGVYFRTSSDPGLERVVGVIPPGQTSVTCQLPEWPEGDSVDIGVKALVANYDVNTFVVTDIQMESSLKWEGGSIPLPPSNITVLKSSESSIQLGWDWTWNEATAAELSWADHEDAWESTNEPSTYTVKNIHASRWTISGLNVGTWYVRIRLLRTIGDATTYGAYSDIYTVKLSSSPDTPSLVLSDGVIPEDGSVTCYWAYVSTDGTSQMQAEIAEASIDDGVISYSDPIASTYTAQHITLEAAEMGWEPGETHNLVVRVMSESGEASADWSAPVPVTIADNIVAEITATSFTQITVPGETSADDRTNVTSLTHFPVSASATGAGEGGTTTFIIERDTGYHVDRPDESDYDGFEGETIAIQEIDGEGSVSFELDDLIGRLDDGASYRLIAIAKDTYGQTSSDSVIFEVHWDHKALPPEAQIEIDETNNVAFITPIAPAGSSAGDTCDIYRLSADKPELVYAGAEFGVKYVDPYPTLGKFGGHRIVYKTFNGDYITASNELAITDYDYENSVDYLNLFAIVVDFDGDQLILPYDVTVSNSWSKDFTETKYLGGTVRGDWNPSVSKSASLTTNIPVKYEPDNIETLRRLAVYPGACHVRTPDGSSYTANVDVKEDREERKVNMLSKAYLDIVKIDAEGSDGMLYSDWISED